MQNLLVSIIIPCRNSKENINGLLNDIAIQKLSLETELIRITNISPSGLARNKGAMMARGEILIFIDCDIMLGNKLVLNNLIEPLLKDKNIGIVCASVRIPPGASKFQICYAKEIAHSESPIVVSSTDVSVATSACCAILKDVFFKIGKFNKDIIRGVDPEFSFRLRSAGYRTVLAAQTWCYHPMPNNIKELMKTQVRDGLGVAFIDTYYPRLNIDVDQRGIQYFSEKKSKLERLLRFFFTFFKAIMQGKFLLLLSKIIYLLGYIYGFFIYRVLSIFRINFTCAE